MTLALSPCPNDVFLYGGLLAGEVGVPGLAFDFIFEDIEALNQRAIQGGADLIKVSYANLPRCVDAYRLLRCGGALGHGCGPLLLTGGEAFDVTREILLPGEATTAHALFNAYASEAWPGIGLRKRFMRFDAIYEALREDPSAQGVVIHEMRFTYARDGLRLVRDLGSFWEASTGGPIPLGALLQRRDSVLPREVVEAVVRQSLAWSREHESQALELCRKHAQSMDDAVMRSHIDLYVNGFSHELGEAGERAVTVFLARCGFNGSPY
jgi:1,4-dihydroxy-6-naphthoate synthase